MPGRKLALIAALLAIPAASNAATVVHDTFADGDRLNQDLANNSVALFKSRTGTTDSAMIGAIVFNPTAAAGADMYWGFFTDAGAPVSLGVGETLTLSLTFSFTGLAAGTNSLRFGVFDSMGSRQEGDLTGGASNASFVGDTGYGLFTTLSTAPPTGNGFNLNERTTNSTSNVFNSAADFTTVGATGTELQALSDNQDYVLTYSIFRQTATDTVLTAGITGGTLSNYTHSVTDTATPQTTFDWFGFRIPGSTFATTISFKDINVTTTTIPEPSTIGWFAVAMSAVLVRRKRKHPRE
jgi:hypothetical protein